MDSSSEWIEGRLIENDFDNAKVYVLYPDYQKEGGSLNYSSYQRTVRKISNKNNVVVLSNIITNSENIEENITNKLKVAAINDQIRLLKAENKQLLSKTLNVNKLMTILEDAVVEYKPLTFVPLKKTPVSDKTAILHISDVHMGEIVSTADTMETNEYNSIIAKSRLDSYFQEAINNSRELGITSAVILFGGDLISGTIHEEILRNSDMMIVQAILEISNYLSQQIRNLSKYFNDIRIYSTTGNHGRILGGKPYFAEFNNLNFETLILHFIKREVNNIVKDFPIEDGIMSFFNVYGFKYMLTHGNIFKGGSGFSLVPNTIPRDSAKIVGFFPDVEAIFMGHFHTSFITKSFVGNLPVFCNGTTMGTNAYSVANYKSFTPPSQNYYVIDKVQGIKYYSEVVLD